MYIVELIITNIHCIDLIFSVQNYSFTANSLEVLKFRPKSNIPEKPHQKKTH